MSIVVISDRLVNIAHLLVQRRGIRTRLRLAFAFGEEAQVKAASRKNIVGVVGVGDGKWRWDGDSVVESG